jgi:predicted enzyme related to lactoylglutathione lyase
MEVSAGGEPMPERDGFPAGVPAWIEIDPPDPAAAAEFYAGLFGWHFENRMPSGSPPYLVARLEGRLVAAVGTADSPAPSPAWITYIGVDDADATAEKVRDAGGSVLTEPTDIGDAGRAATCADPSGARFRIWQPGTIRGAQAVNAPGAWNFSELHARDVDAARVFYGEVFGWETDKVDMGAIAGTMIRLPGYADFLEQFDPGIRQRHADFGAPPGFSECVGWMHPLEAGEEPHWSVTFSVADADAVADSARSLGGTVVVEPFDLPMVRSAVVRDPWGARFSVSAFNPG